MASARPSRRTRPWTASTVVAVAALALTGCSATNPITTAESYNVVDGVQEELGSDVAARSLLVLTAEEGAPGTLLGALANRSREAVEVTLEPDGGDAVTIDVPAGGTVLLGGENGEEVELDRVGVAPGGLLDVTATTPDGGATRIRVPVFDGTLPEYADAVPDAD
ncbi:hypothetical protein [uncultured Cellulomonas sp.]|uniref:hypothetical protein n=1 Tax=uncultured Cellulomonas sp. TaxID=189682 RepID=UPI0026063B9D|nr:hypothetical protein [uncultured Cellulomonas sp.]